MDTKSNYGYPDRTRRPPLIPNLLSMLMEKSDDPTGIALFLVFQSLAGALTAVMIGLLGWVLSKTRFAYYLLVAFYSFWGPAMVLAPCVMTETLFTLFFTISALLLFRAFETGSLREFFAAGLFVGLASLTRPILYPLYFYLAVCWPFLFAKKPAITSRKKGLAAAIFFLALFVMIMPWISRNTKVNGRFTLITSNVGLNLLMNNHPMGQTEAWKYAMEQAQPGGPLFGMDEAGRDAVMLDKAISFIQQDPGGFVSAVLDRFYRFYTDSKQNFPEILPIPIEWKTYLSFFLFLGIYTIFKRRFSAGLLLTLMLLNFNTIYCLTFFEARFREVAISLHLAAGTVGAVVFYRTVAAYLSNRKKPAQY